MKQTIINLAKKIQEALGDKTRLLPEYFDGLTPTQYLYQVNDVFADLLGDEYNETDIIAMFFMLLSMAEEAEVSSSPLRYRTITANTDQKLAERLNKYCGEGQPYEPFGNILYDSDTGIFTAVLRRQKPLPDALRQPFSPEMMRPASISYEPQKEPEPNAPNQALVFNLAQRALENLETMEYESKSPDGGFFEVVRIKNISTRHPSYGAVRDTTWRKPYLDSFNDAIAPWTHHDLGDAATYRFLTRSQDGPEFEIYNKDEKLIVTVRILQGRTKIYE